MTDIILRDLNGIRRVPLRRLRLIGQYAVIPYLGDDPVGIERDALDVCVRFRHSVDIADLQRVSRRDFELRVAIREVLIILFSIRIIITIIGNAVNFFPVIPYLLLQCKGDILLLVIRQLVVPGKPLVDENAGFLLIVPYLQHVAVEEFVYAVVPGLIGRVIGDHKAVQCIVFFEICIGPVIFLNGGFDLLQIVDSILLQGLAVRFLRQANLHISLPDVSGSLGGRKYDLVPVPVPDRLIVRVQQDELRAGKPGLHMAALILKEPDEVFIRVHDIIAAGIDDPGVSDLRGIVVPALQHRVVDEGDLRPRVPGNTGPVRDLRRCPVRDLIGAGIAAEIIGHSRRGDLDGFIIDGLGNIARHGIRCIGSVFGGVKKRIA